MKPLNLLAGILIGFLLVLGISPLQNQLAANSASANATTLDPIVETIFPLFYVALILIYWGALVFKAGTAYA